MKPVTHMSYASNIGLGRGPCATCNAETLHKGGKCVHCGDRQGSTVARRVSWNEADARNLQMRQARKTRVRA